MGMTPILWTSTIDGGKFDSNGTSSSQCMHYILFKYLDWRVAGGSVNSTSSYQTFQDILKNGTDLDTGFVYQGLFCVGGLLILRSE